MSVDQKILAMRGKLQQLKAEEDRLRKELHTLFKEKVESTCPITVGTKIEYEAGKLGQVDRIQFVTNGWEELEPSAEVHWAVTGRKINKTGEFGVKDFHPVGPATHYVNGTFFTRKGIGGILGIDDD